MPTRALAPLVTAALIALVLLSAVAPGAGSPRPAPLSDPAPQRFATCDVYHVVQGLYDSDRYTPARKTEEESIHAELKPLADELQILGDKAQSVIQTGSPNDPAAAAIVRDFQEKRTAFNKKQKEMGERLQAFKAKQLVECYELARASAGAVAEKAGYTHVIASRRVSEKLPADDPQVVVEALLQRPALFSPAAADITDAVLADLKL